jgi:hypothetical protein
MMVGWLGHFLNPQGTREVGISDTACQPTSKAMASVVTHHAEINKIDRQAG